MYLSYNDAAKELVSYGKHTVSVLNTINKGLNNSHHSISNLIEMIEKIKTQLPQNVNTGKIIKTSDVNQDGFRDGPFSQFWQSFITNTIAISTISDYNKDIYDEVIVKIDEIKNEYSSRIQLFEKKINQSKDALKKSSDINNKYYQNYKNMSKQIEESCKTIQNDQLINKNNEQAQKLVAAFEETKKAYIKAYNEAIEKHNEYNLQRENFSTEMEEAFLMFEEYDRELYEKICNLVQEIPQHISKHTKSKLARFHLNDKYITCKPPDDEFEKFLKQNQLDSINEKTTEIEFVPNKIAFDITQIVNPAKLFKKELTGIPAIVLSDYTAKKANEISVKKGCQVTVFKKNGFSKQMKKVQIDESGLKGYVPSKILQENTDQSSQKVLMKVKETYQKDNFSVKAGEYVLSYKRDGSIIYCYNAYYEHGSIPLSMLELIK